MNATHETDALTPSRLRAVLAVAQTGSFSEAAVELATSQSAVSRAVAAVERALGPALFDRSTRTVRLTDAGRDFVERAALITADLDAAARAVRPDTRPVRRLVLASLTSISEVHLATALADDPNGPPRVRCIEGLQSVVEHAVRSGAAAVGFGDAAGTAPDLAVRALWHEPFKLAVPRGHRLARRSSVELDDLDRETLIGFSREAELRTTVDRELAAARRLRTPDYVVDRFRTALSLVGAGLGVMVVPTVAVPAAPAGTALVGFAGDGMHRTIGVMRLVDAEEPAAIAAIIDRLLARVVTLPDVSAAA